VYGLIWAADWILQSLAHMNDMNLLRLFSVSVRHSDIRREAQKGDEFVRSDTPKYPASVASLAFGQSTLPAFFPRFTLNALIL